MTGARWAIAISLIAACGSDQETPIDAAIPGELACRSDDALTFAELHPQVIASACASCHNGVLVDSAPDMSTPSIALTAIRGVVSPRYAGPDGALQIVDPGAPQNSTMMLKVLGGAVKGITGPNGEDVGGAMPQIGSLSKSQKDAIRNWICAGANP